MFDLLTEPLVPVGLNGGRGLEAVTLPEVYARLVDDEVDSFPGLAAHQGQAWYQFLAQLGGLALCRGGLEEPPVEADAWRELLSDLAPGCADTAWSLVVTKATAAAFLQPPTAQMERYRLEAATPDGLDVLLTAKNHDRKQAQAVAGAPHLWLYALLTLQTLQGYSGPRNPGIARMNGAHGSRVLVDRRPNPRWGARVKRAIRMLLARREDVLRRVGDQVYRSAGGLALTWLESWDSDEPLRMSNLDPFFVEVCRRVRLTLAADDRIVAMAWKPSNATRVDARAWKGNVGDAWVPVNLGETDSSALTVSGNGFDYRLAQRILLDRKSMKPPLALKTLPGEGDEDSEIHMMVLVRGQGKTEGLHERVIPMPRQISAQLSFEDDEGGHDQVPLAELSHSMVALAGESRKVLRQAVLVYLQGPEAPNFQKRDATTVVSGYDRTVDGAFFPHLFAAPEIGAEGVCGKWQRFLRDEAVRLAQSVWNRMPSPRARREKARAASEAVLFGGLRKRLPDAFPAKEDSA